MSEQNNVLALKTFAAAFLSKIANIEIDVNDIPGTTMADVFHYMTEAMIGGTLGELTVKSTEGTENGKTIITVSPELTSGNSYVYKTAQSVETPTYNQDLSDWTTWDGTSEITAISDYQIVIAEVDSNMKAKNAGRAIVVANFS